MSKTAYLGPTGTFCETALQQLDSHSAHVPFPTIGAALQAARNGEVDAAVIPLENSVEGAIVSTLDELAWGEPLIITAETFLPVEFSLLVRPGSRPDEIKRVISHPAAHAQCRGFIVREFPGAVLVTAPSTAAAAQEVAEIGAPHDAAIAAPIAARRYGLAEVASRIGDRADTVTRFVRVGRPGVPPGRTGADRTSLIVFLREDRPGALAWALTEFSLRGINLTRVESRPTGDGIGNYFFHLDCAGHISEARMGEAVSALHRNSTDVRFLGSYPCAEGSLARTQPGASEEDFREASSWLARIRGTSALSRGEHEPLRLSLRRRPACLRPGR